MSDIAIQVEKLSKRYRIGMKEEMQDNVVAAFSDFLARPVRNFRKLRRLSKFGENGQEPDDIIWALKDVSFEVKHGEVVGIIGRNGAGKSTILKVLTRITYPTSGIARVNGRVGSLLEVGTGFHDELTGRENTYLNGSILGMKKAEIDRKFDEIVDFAGVERFIDTPVKRYSSGMKVRLAFAVAAHLEPEVLLIDEVLAVGDAEFQKRCLGKMEGVAKEGRTVIFVSHSMGAMQALTTRCIYLENGHIRAAGPTTEIIEQFMSSVEPSSATFDFRDAPRQKAVYGERLRICKITPKHDSDVGFYLNQDLTFGIELESNMSARDLRFGMTISSLTGSPVLTTMTPKVVEVSHSKGLSYEIKIIDSRLVPGNYRLSLSVGEGGQDEARVNYDVVNPGPAFTISPLTRSGETLFNWMPVYGSIYHTKAVAIRTEENVRLAAPDKISLG